jgi:AcrR family transcriptional regulator
MHKVLIGRRDPEMEVKVRNIADKTRRIFMKYGIRSVSMDDISRELGMSKKTLYQHFMNKSDLVHRVLQCNYNEFQEKVAEIFRENQNAIDDLLSISLIIDKNMKDVNLAVTFDLQKYYPELYREFLDRKRRFASDYLKQNIEKGKKENIYRQDLNVELIAKMYVQQMEDMHDPSFYDKDAISFSEVFKVMFENHIRGIANENGIKYFEERKKTLNSQTEDV